MSETQSPNVCYLTFCILRPLSLIANATTITQAYVIHAKIPIYGPLLGTSKHIDNRKHGEQQDRYVSVASVSIAGIIALSFIMQMLAGNSSCIPNRLSDLLQIFHVVLILQCWMKILHYVKFSYAAASWFLKKSDIIATSRYSTRYYQYSIGCYTYSDINIA